MYFEERRSNKEQLRSKEHLTDHDIVEMATAHFLLHGAKKLVDFILSWQPPEVVFRVTRLFIKRLVDAGNFTTVDEISHLGCRNQYLMIAVADELIAVGKFPPIDAMEICLDLLAHKRVRIPKATQNCREQPFTPAIVSFLEACSAVGLSQTKILRVLNHYLPQRASGFVSNHYFGEWNTFLQGVALKSAILEIIELEPEALMPEYPGLFHSK